MARLGALDPVTNEVVRLRGATQHNCGLSDAHKAALRYVDALIWTPARIEAEVAAGVLRHFSEQQAWELTLDVMRNATNKIAVSLGADEPRVAEGTERYLIGADGQPVYADIA